MTDLKITKDAYDGQSLLFYAPSMRSDNFVSIEEGAGDNLLPEDIAAGYVDYVNWNSFSLDMDPSEPKLIPFDGGMLLFKTEVSKTPLAEIVKEVMREAGLNGPAYKIGG